MRLVLAHRNHRVLCCLRGGFTRGGVVEAHHDIGLWGVEGLVQGRTEQDCTSSGE